MDIGDDLCTGLLTKRYYENAEFCGMEMPLWAKDGIGLDWYCLCDESMLTCCRKRF
jgi:hypothetical protein